MEETRAAIFLVGRMTCLFAITFSLTSCSDSSFDEKRQTKIEKDNRPVGKKELLREDSAAFFSRLQSDSVFRAFTEKDMDRNEYLNWLEYSYRISLAADGQELTIDAIDNSHGHPADYNRPFVVTEPEDIARLRNYLQEELSKPISSIQDTTDSRQNEVKPSD